MHNSGSHFSGLFRSVRTAPPTLFAGRRRLPLPLVLTGIARLVALAGGLFAVVQQAQAQVRPGGGRVVSAARRLRPAPLGLGVALLALTLGLAGLLLWPTPAESRASKRTLVTNVEIATDDDSVSMGGNDHAQLFHTGAETHGYRLTSVILVSENTADNEFAVDICPVDGSNLPSASGCTVLLAPDGDGDFEAGNVEFTHPGGISLAANTNYVAVIKQAGSGNVTLDSTTSNAQHANGLADWSIGDKFYRKNGGSWTEKSDSDEAIQIKVRGYATPANEDPTGRPVVYPAAVGAGILVADTYGIDDPNGPTWTNTTGHEGVGLGYFDFSYQWTRVDPANMAETPVGVDSFRYQPVEADIGQLIKVEVSFSDGDGYEETATASLPFGPIVRQAAPQPASTLVANTGQSPSAAATISQQYAQEFQLGVHGQGYELSSVVIDLAAAPSRLSVSLWIGGQADPDTHRGTANKVFDFANPPSFRVGLNEFRAPAGAFAYHNVHYWIVLSDFGPSLSIRETTSDAEDAGGEPGARVGDGSLVRALDATGAWRRQLDYADQELLPDPTSRTSVLRMAVKGSQRAGGFLAANYAQAGGEQEIISVGDKGGVPITLGAADRYLIRGFSWHADGTKGGSLPTPYYVPFDLRTGIQTGDDLGDKLFGLTPTGIGEGVNVWAAPQGATVTGGAASYLVYQVYSDSNRPPGVVLGRVSGTGSTKMDAPPAEGVSLGESTVEDVLIRALMALLGEPLVAMVQNLGQTTNSYSTADSASPLLTQEFTTGSDDFGYRLQGIGVNIEGSEDTNMVAQIPDDSTAVSVALYSNANGKPGTKLFDLLSPTEFAVGHSFFEAPPGTFLTPSTSYVLVWRYIDGQSHRLDQTTSNSEDTGGSTGASIANVSFGGSSLSSLTQNSGGNSLLIGVYTEVLTKARDAAPVPLSWLHIPDGVGVGDQFRSLFVSHRGRLPTSSNIEHYNDFVQWEAAQPYSHDVIEANASEFKAVVCTEDVNARANTGMEGETGVPIHWLDGGWEDKPTLVAASNDDFYGATWQNASYGAYVTGNSAHFEDHAMVWTGCDASGVAHPEYHMGNTENTHMVAVGTPKGRSLKTREKNVDTNFAPLGAVDVSEGFAYREYYVDIDGERHERRLPLYAISPIFRVVDDGSRPVIWSAVLRVGATTATVGTDTLAFVGFSADTNTKAGSLSSTQFTYDGTSHSVTQLWIQTGDTTNNSDGLIFFPSPLFASAEDANLLLTLNDNPFPLADAVRLGETYTWTNHGQTWADGDIVVVKLIKQRSTN